MDVSGCEEAESAKSKDMPDKNVQPESSSEDMEEDTTFYERFDDYDYYCPMPDYDDEIFPLEEKPVNLLDELEEKPATPCKEMVQDGENIPVGFPRNDFACGESLAVKREDIGEREDTFKKAEPHETDDQSEKTSFVNSAKIEIQDSVDQRDEIPILNFLKEEIPEESSGTLKRTEEIPDSVDQMLETPVLNSVKEEIPEESLGSFRRVEIPDSVDQREEIPILNFEKEDVPEDISEEIHENVEQREETPQENSFNNGISRGTRATRVGNPEKTKVNIKIVSETVTPVEEVSDTEKTDGTNVPKFTTVEIEKIWALAKKLCVTRCAYNQNVCRPITAVNQKLPPKKRKHAETLVECRPHRRSLNTMTNGGVCTIGKGDNSQYDDPPDWDWGQPLPEEICEVVPSKPPPGTPTITVIDDECPSSSFKCFDKMRPPRPKRIKPRSPVSKNLKISISVTRFNSSSDTTIVLSDSDEELPDFSMQLGVDHRKAELRSERIDVTSDGNSCSVICSSAPQQLAPTTRYRNRRRPTGLRAPAGRSYPNINPHEVVVLESSDESDDPDLKVVEVSKPAPNENSNKPNPSPKTDEDLKTAWNCPICLEAKENVTNIMSTTCGHIFCGPCLQSSIKMYKQCPNCRKKLTLRQIHNLYM